MNLLCVELNEYFMLQFPYCNISPLRGHVVTDIPTDLCRAKLGKTEWLKCVWNVQNDEIMNDANAAMTLLEK